MIHASSITKWDFFSESIQRVPYLRYFFFGLLLPFGFSPFHFPGLTLLGLALFYRSLTSAQDKSPFLAGLTFGLGYFGLGVSWIYISIHEYGHLHGIIAALITLMFVLYLAIFPALTAVIFSRLACKPHRIYSCLLFSAIWIGCEYLRAIFFSGFPWLLVGFGQFDTPLKFLLPVIGVFGVGFITCFAATLLGSSTNKAGSKRYFYLIMFVAVILFPLLFKTVTWGEKDAQGISVGIIQANLSMRDKWDENLFWQLLELYHRDTEKLLGTQLIVLPESAFPLPATYISDFLSDLHKQAKKAGSAILLGIPEPATIDEAYYFNTLMTIGKAKGSYIKQHLVPFGEYIPEPFLRASNWLGIPEANLKPGKNNQELIKVQHHPIASLICYELGYGNLLRQQLPAAHWIVSISDDGWFGHSLAMYQQQQMAQVLSMETARYQVVANNDGLSSVINTEGEIEASLPAFDAGILKATLFPATGQTPWVLFGDWPILLFSLLLIVISVTYRCLMLKDRKQSIAAKDKRRYPYHPR
ncbi:MAG: apolipoprotein N-acyltransferase [Legionella sp.]|nr:apolipoprotein N-acyltransferase [Legionella sp.]